MPTKQHPKRDVHGFSRMRFDSVKVEEVLCISYTAGDGTDDDPVQRHERWINMGTRELIYDSGSDT